jgi:hypothetical protein
MVVRLDRGRRPLRAMLRERFYWGRLFASTRVREISAARRAAYAVLSPALVPVFLARAARAAWRAPGHRGWLVVALPGLVALTASWSLGEMVGYATGREGAG